MKLPLLIFFICLLPISTVFSQNPNTESPTFNYLYIKADSFKALTKDKYVFQHYVDKSFVLSMHGWDADGLWGRKFDTTPIVQLQVWKRSEVSVLNTYLGNVLISKHDLKRIKKKLTDKTLYVVFEPDVSKGFLRYKILITDDELSPKGLKALRDPILNDIKFSASPSPPKNFY